jgi:chemotaxis-related protein WspB
MLALTFRVGPSRLALDVRRVREVVPRVRLQPLACGPAWLAGAFVYRGRVVPVVDLHRLLGAGECPPLLSSRIILVPYGTGEQEPLLGLLAAEVAEAREVEAPARAPLPAGAPGQPDPGPVLVEGGNLLHLVELERLLPETVRGQLAAAPRELLT